MQRVLGGLCESKRRVLELLTLVSFSSVVGMNVTVAASGSIPMQAMINNRVNPLCQKNRFAV